MLNGLDPLIIFSFFKNLSTVERQALEDFPISKFTSQFSLPPIPIYLNEQTTGIYIESEQKNIDIETNQNTLVTGLAPEFTQKGIASVVKVDMLANKNSIGLSILATLADLVLPKVTSKEYNITYIHNTTTIFGGLLHSFSISEESNSELVHITMEIIKNSKTSAKVEVPNQSNAFSLNNTGPTPTGGSVGSVQTPPGAPGAPLKIGGVP